MSSRAGSTFARALSIVIVLFLVVATVIITYQFPIRWCLQWAQTLDQQVSASLAVGAIVVLLAAKIIANGSAYGVRAIVESRSRLLRPTVYSQLIEALYVNLNLPTSPVAVDKSNMQRSEAKLLLVGSLDVLQHYTALRHSMVIAASDEAMQVALHRLIFAMRLDLGIFNVGLAADSIAIPAKEPVGGNVS